MGCLFLRVGFIKCEPTLKSLGMVSGPCELRQYAKEQMCFGCMILVSDPAGPGRLALCAGPTAVAAAHTDTPGCPVVLPSAGQERNNQEDLSASNFLQAHTPAFLSRCLCWSAY